VFEDWLDDASGSAPGRIRAVMPHEKDGKDQSLEMDARFAFAKPGIWMLQEVKSHFRNEGGGSTGTITFVSPTEDAYTPIHELVQKAGMTEQLLQAVESAPAGTANAEMNVKEWTSLPMRAVWTEKARQSATEGKNKAETPLLIGIHRARISQAAPELARIELEGVSTTCWKAFLTGWKLKLENSAGNLLAQGSTNVTVRAEGGPAQFLVSMEVPVAPNVSLSNPVRVSVEGAVKRLTGAYHGHSLWITYARQDGDEE
ncbi:MAG TPA: hypothetical protein VEC99_12925, partial [Clostridia bacterium]|nr:hypothetical protein [Clostridia bacterium]